MKIKKRQVGEQNMSCPACLFYYFRNANDLEMLFYIMHVSKEAILK